MDETARLSIIKGKAKVRSVAEEIHGLFEDSFAVPKILTDDLQEESGPFLIAQLNTSDEWVKIQGSCESQPVILELTDAALSKPNQILEALGDKYAVVKSSSSWQIPEQIKDVFRERQIAILDSMVLDCLEDNHEFTLHFPADLERGVVERYLPKLPETQRPKKESTTKGGGDIQKKAEKEPTAEEREDMQKKS
jgi:hypothetical protein